jgi:hypothetical protein
MAASRIPAHSKRTWPIKSLCNQIVAIKNSFLSFYGAIPLILIKQNLCLFAMKPIAT